MALDSDGQSAGNIAENQITDENLDDFLATGGEVLRGLELMPEGREGSPWPLRANVQQGELDKGYVWPTAYLDVPPGADRQDRLGALMFYCKRTHRT